MYRALTCVGEEAYPVSMGSICYPQLCSIYHQIVTFPLGSCLNETHTQIALFDTSLIPTINLVSRVSCRKWLKQGIRGRDDNSGKRRGDRDSLSCGRIHSHNKNLADIHPSRSFPYIPEKVITSNTWVDRLKEENVNWLTALEEILKAKLLHFFIFHSLFSNSSKNANLFRSMVLELNHFSWGIP